MPELHEVTGGNNTEIYHQATMCQTCFLAVPWTIIVGLTKFGNQAKPLKYSEEKLYFILI